MVEGEGRGGGCRPLWTLAFMRAVWNVDQNIPSRFNFIYICIVFDSFAFQHSFSAEGSFQMSSKICLTISYSTRKTLAVASNDASPFLFVQKEESCKVISEKKPPAVKFQRRNVATV